MSVLMIPFHVWGIVSYMISGISFADGTPMMGAVKIFMLGLMGGATASEIILWCFACVLLGVEVKWFLGMKGNRENTPRNC